MNAPFRSTSHESGWIHPEFESNRAKYPAEELWKFADQFVAWSWDGTVIVAAAATEGELLDRVRELGLRTDHVVFSYVPDPNVSYL